MSTSLFTRPRRMAAAIFAGGVFLLLAIPQIGSTQQFLGLPPPPYCHAQPYDPVWSPSAPVPNAVTVPTDGPRFPGFYPNCYFGEPMGTTAIVGDPYCHVQRNYVSFPHTWLGALTLPISPGGSLPTTVTLGVSTKDFYDAGFGNPSLEPGCGGGPVTMPQAMSQTIGRIRDMGARYVAVASFSFLVDQNATPLAFDPASEQVSASDLVFIAQQVHAAGMTFTFYPQVPGGDETRAPDGGPSPPLPSQPSLAWFTNFLDVYTTRLYSLAAEAQAAGVDAIGLNWLEYWVDYTNRPDLEDLFNSKMLTALAGVRARFTGKVILHDAGWSAVRPSGQALFAGVDAVTWAPPAQILNACEDGNTAKCPGASLPTVALVKSKYASALSAMNARLSPFQKPIIVEPMIQSHRYFFETGWVEESPGLSCLSGCTQQQLQTDFSVQAMGYEGLLEAVADLVHAGSPIASVEPPNYWYTDQMQPETLFPNIGQTVRNKPAEMLLYQWFHH